MILTRSRKRRIGEKISPLQKRWRLKDPITLDRIEKLFLYIDAEGNEMHFDATVLASYILSSGDYRNPLTRKPFNMVEIRRLARRANMPEILDVELRKKERELTTQRDSLRDFFVGEIENDLALLSELRISPSLSIQVRHMITHTFPQLVTNCVRIIRTDREFLPEYFRSVFRFLHNVQQEAASQNLLMYATALQIYEQFCRDLQTRCSNESLVNGNRARVSIGGMNVAIDIRNVV